MIYSTCMFAPVSHTWAAGLDCVHIIPFSPTGRDVSSVLPMCADHISHRHLFWPRLPARLCRKWCRNGWTVGMAETEEEALRWKVHLKGFGNNPLKLPQGIGWNGLHLDSPLCSCHSLCAYLFKGRGVLLLVVSFLFFKKQKYEDFPIYYGVLRRSKRSERCFPTVGRGSPICSLISHRWKEMPVTRRSKDHWFRISLVSCLADARGLLRNSCCFSPSHFSCHFDFIMQDLCWVHSPLKWGKRPVIQLLKLQADSSGPERKPAALIPLSARERFATWPFVAAIWYILSPKRLTEAWKICCALVLLVLLHSLWTQ